MKVGLFVLSSPTIALKTEDTSKASMKRCVSRQVNATGEEVLPPSYNVAVYPRGAVA